MNDKECKILAGLEKFAKDLETGSLSGYRTTTLAAQEDGSIKRTVREPRIEENDARPLH